MKRWFWFALILALCLPFCSHAQVIWHDPARTVTVHSVTLDEEEWLFLPSGSDLSALQLEQDGVVHTVDWTALSAEDESRQNVHSGIWNDETLHIMVSENLRSLHLLSTDPVHQGRVWLEDSAHHERFTTAKLIVMDPNGISSYPYNIMELRGRGNSTWRGTERGRRPYQIKLEDRADLMNTGLRHEYSRTWVLLTNDDDDTLLRNQLGLDVAKELGMESTSRCEQVDLYYDGDYRGAYLLAEKVEVGEHSVDIADFDRLLKPINELLRVPDPDLLGDPRSHGGHVAIGATERGSYSHFHGVYDNQDLTAGGYLLEYDGDATMSERTWITLPEERFLAFKNPEYAGPTMIAYIQNLFMDAYEAMLNHGYHPETDQPLEELIDIDSFTRSHLVQEILHNSNAYFYASTFFYIPQGETKLYAGPVWDFDHVAYTPWPGLKDNNAMSHAFYRTTVFQRAAKQIWRNEVEPMLQNILFGENTGKYLRPLKDYCSSLHSSWLMNYYRFFSRDYADEQYETTMDVLYSRLESQCEFLSEEIFAWGEDEPTHVADIYFELPYADPQLPTLCLLNDGEQYGSLLLNTTFACIEPATEEDWATWQVTFTLRAKPHCTIPEDIAVTINGIEYPFTIEDNTITFTFEYVDYYYRPAVVDGVDYGDVFDYDIYISMYPELEEEGLSREDVIRHFRDVGMAQGDCANDYFDPLNVFFTIYSACEKYGEDWPLYYAEYLLNPLGWSEEMGFIYEPEWTQILP